MLATSAPYPESAPVSCGHPVNAAQGDLLTPAIKLAGFLAVLAVIFGGAHAAGSYLGPVTTSHSQVQYDNGGSGPGMGGMKMGITP
jgi:hypothetical protein